MEDSLAERACYNTSWKDTLVQASESWVTKELKRSCMWMGYYKDGMKGTRRRGSRAERSMKHMHPASGDGGCML